MLKDFFLSFFVPLSKIFYFVIYFEIGVIKGHFKYNFAMICNGSCQLHAIVQCKHVAVILTAPNTRGAG